jgi:hypothetical protein
VVRAHSTTAWPAPAEPVLKALKKLAAYTFGEALAAAMK